MTRLPQEERAANSEVTELTTDNQAAEDAMRAKLAAAAAAEPSGDARAVAAVLEAEAVDKTAAEEAVVAAAAANDKHGNMTRLPHKRSEQQTARQQS